MSIYVPEKTQYVWQRTLIIFFSSDGNLKQIYICSEKDNEIYKMKYNICIWKVFNGSKVVVKFEEYKRLNSAELKLHYVGQEAFSSWSSVQRPGSFVKTMQISFEIIWKYLI